MKKTLALLLALALILSCMAGCKKTEKPEEPKVETVDSEEQSVSADESAEGPAGLGDVPDAPEEDEAAEEDDGNISLEGLLGALEKADGDIGAILDVIGEEFGGDIYKDVGISLCTVDDTHPNDLGFWCMAKAYGNILKELFL